MEILINIFGGVALMLWGIRMVRTGVMRSFGAELRRMLAMSAGKPVQGFGVGFAVTTVLQSSTATHADFIILRRTWLNRRCRRACDHSGRGCWHNDCCAGFIIRSHMAFADAY